MTAPRKSSRSSTRCSAPYPCGCDCFHTLTARRARRRASRRSFASTTRCTAGATSRSTSSPPTSSIARRRPRPIRAIAASPCATTRASTAASSASPCTSSSTRSRATRRKANYGIPWGAPYSVPVDLPEGEEAAFLHPFNVGEARAFVGVRPVAPGALRHRLGRLHRARRRHLRLRRRQRHRRRAARLPPGAALGSVSTIRASTTRCARALEEAERGYFTDEKLRELRRALRRRRGARPHASQERAPAADELARIPPRLPGRNDVCLCGSGEKYKKCCAPRYGA